ncbi:MAG: [FeFe] hydrogenase H-cluster maturation GTPase HydF [Clostridia bacterium]|nr:[FeFe] hydrogenase H-cluster maturation GTPase HydF [Clostridia bacterium]
MGMNSTPSANRTHIGFFGLRNAGKSSLVNRICGQEISVVSDYAGTTTDPVKKSMELLPLGPVVIVDTPGFDDEGALGKKRVEKTMRVLATIDIAVLVSDAARELTDSETEIKNLFETKKIPYIIVKNKADLTARKGENNEAIFASALTGEGVEEIKQKLASMNNQNEHEVHLISDKLKRGDIAVLVVPIDSSAPKGRLILPQQQVIRDLLDAGVAALVTQDDNYPSFLDSLSVKPAVVICDSQVFGKVNKATPKDIPLTSFSILMARMKGFLDTAVKGAKTLSDIRGGDKILISEGCTHHRQCEDIGTVKLPRWIKEYTKCEPVFEFSQGNSFPEDLSPYKLIIHCGGCMITENEVKYRMNAALSQNIPFTNYGTAIAYMNGILERSCEIFDLK